MHFGFRILAALLILGFGAMPASSAFAQTKIALHATQEEINIWKQRRVSGPYLDDWKRILANANAFKATPTGKWLGNHQNQAWAGDAVRDCLRKPTVYPGGNPDINNCAANGRTFADKIRDAGLVYLITGDTSYRDSVVTLLLDQIDEAGTDFTNTTRWPTTYTNQDKDFHISIWLRKMAYAYSYVRGSVTTQQRSAIDAWFNGAATWLNHIVHNAAGRSSRWPDRLNDDYAGTPSTSSCSTCGTGLTHFGGYTVNGFGFAWDNKATNHNAAVAAIGAVTGNATHINRAKRFVKEWLKYNVGADGTVWDQARWQRGNAQSGWNYATTTIGSIINAVDHIARTGDTELYEYSTSEGLHWSAGGPKSLLKVLQRYSNMALNNIHVYASTTSTTDASKKIDPDGNSPESTQRLISDIAFVQANVFYKDSLVAQVYNRSLPTNPASSGYDPWGGDWGNLPGARFMFGQMEGKVWPFTIEPVSSSPSASPTGPVNSPPPPSSAGSAGYWKFDEGFGTTAKDSSGTGNHGILINGARWTTGKSGSAISFDGIDDFVKISTTNFSASQGTVAVWVKASSFGSSPRYLFGHTSLPAYGNRIQLYTDDTGGNLDMGLGASHKSALNIQQLQVNTWHHVTFTWSSGAYTVYVNGTQKTKGTYSGLASLNSYAHIGGVGVDSKLESWSGAIDEVKVWNRALNSTEVQNEYNSNEISPLLPPSGLAVGTVR